MRKLILVIGMSLLWAGSSWAKDSKGLPYKGLAPGGGTLPQGMQPPATGGPYIIWPGFHYDRPNKTAIVFVQLTAAVNYEVQQKGRRVHVLFDGVNVYLKNNFRRMITRHFPGGVSSLQLKRVKTKTGSRLRLDIKLKRKRKPIVAMSQQGKYHMLTLSFPPKS